VKDSISVGQAPALAAPSAPNPHLGYAERHFLSQDGLDLYYRKYGGAGAGRMPVLCLAGLVRNSKDFHELAMRLARDRRVLVPDYRGRGRSARDPNWRNYRPETYISDALDLLTVAGVDRVVIIGTSLGGLLAMGIAALRPNCLAGVILNDIGPEIAPDGYRRIMSYVSADRPQPDWPSAIADMKQTFNGYPSQSPEQWQRLAEGTYRLGHDGLLHFDWDVAVKRGLKASQERFPDLWPLYRALGDRPALVLRGALSDVLNAETFERMAREKPDLLRAVVPDVGHVPVLDEKEARIAIDEFFARF
jgi:pimeloyl-ACP methyl ester carboxylesterase